jgi:hypothetical protein
MSARAHSERMVTFKCPYCRTEYGMTMAHLAFQQRSYAKCQVCYRTMYSWASRNVPLFTLMDASEGKAPETKPQPAISRSRIMLHVTATPTLTVGAGDMGQREDVAFDRRRCGSSTVCRGLKTSIGNNARRVDCSFRPQSRLRLELWPAPDSAHILAARSRAPSSQGGRL